MPSDRACNWPLFRVALSPSVGPAPKPPTALGEALALLDAPIADQMRIFATNRAAKAGDPYVAAINRLFDFGADPRDRREEMDDYGGMWLADAFARSVRAVPAVRRARATGLTSNSASRWVEIAQAGVAPEEQSCVVSYIQACRQWEQCLDRNIGSMAADPDWDMGSAKKVRPSAPEAHLAQSLEQAGIPMQAQVGVSRNGGPRHGGWFRNYWLDCAHRDVAFLLRIDVELDGATHRTPEVERRDAMRNTLLRQRGWYVLRFDNRNLDREQHNRALDVIVKLVQRHRRSVVLARTNFDGAWG
jgi:hypothetical protein